MTTTFQADFASFNSKSIPPVTTTPTTATPTSNPENYKFDQQRLQKLDSSEKKELFVFQWLSILEKELKKGDKTTIANEQDKVEKLLLKFLSSTSPKPTRPTRKLIARCFNLIFTYGSQRKIFDTIVAIQQLLKNVTENSNKLAVIHCLGAITEVHGKNVMSLFSETVISLVKLMKQTTDVHIRHEILDSLCRGLKGAGRALAETTAKDIFKLCKHGFNDKSLIIRADSGNCLQALYEYTIYPKPAYQGDYESLIILMIKGMDKSNFKVRQSLSSAASYLLVTFLQSPIPKKKSSSVPAPPTYPTIDEALSILYNAFNKYSSREILTGIIECYASFYQKMGIQWIEDNYSLILNHTLSLLKNTKSDQNSSLIVSEYCKYLLRNVIGKILSESAQNNAVKIIINEHIKKVLANKTFTEEKDLEMKCILDELAALLLDLGPALIYVPEVAKGLNSIISYPNRAVNITASWCIRCFCKQNSTYINQEISYFVNQLNNAESSLNENNKNSIEKYISFCYPLATLITLIPQRSLNVSIATAAQLFNYSSHILKSIQGGQSSNIPLKIMDAKIQVAWTIIDALMSLGPKFVKVHLTQLLNLWKNALPKISMKDNSIQYSEKEIIHQIDSRSYALSALHSFLEYNDNDLINIDISKRIVICLNNVLAFISSLPKHYSNILSSTLNTQSLINTATSASITVPFSSSSTPLKKVMEREYLMKKRLYQCYCKFSDPSVYEMAQTILLKSTLELIAPDYEKNTNPFTGNISSHHLNSSILAGSYTTSLIKGIRVEVANHLGLIDRGINNIVTSDYDVQRIEELIDQKSFSSCENDPHILFEKEYCLDTSDIIQQCPVSPPLNIGMVDAAIELYSKLFPIQGSNHQETCNEYFLKVTKYLETKIWPGKKEAVQTNLIIAILGSLKYILKNQGSLKSNKVASQIKELILSSLSHSSYVIRAISSETVGRLAQVMNTATFTNPLMKELIDKIVNLRDPETRSGCSLALGCIQGHVGGMAGGSQLKTIVGILHSLASDPHPQVHMWALYSIWLIIEGSGLMYSTYVNSTLSIISKLIMSETHEPVSSFENYNSIHAGYAGVYPAFGKILYALIGVIGPELMLSSKLRDLCFNLYEEFKNDSDPFVVVEAIRCIQHFILFAPKHLDVGSLIPFLQYQLSNDNKSQVQVLRKGCVTCLYQLVQREPELVLRNANKLEEQLFGLLDIEPDKMVKDEIKDILLNLLRCVGPKRPSQWLLLIKIILSKSGTVGGASNDSSMIHMNEQDEDDEEYFTNIDESDKKPSKVVQFSSKGKNIEVVLLPRWRTHLFALNCLRELLNVIYKTGQKAHYDLQIARKIREQYGDKNTDFLVFKLNDLIQMAFGTATATVIDLRLGGLNVLQDILQKFSDSEDPDYEGHALIEQYQAQISAALTPAFSKDAPLEVTSVACRVCSKYIGSGINKDLSTLSRVLKNMNHCLLKYTSIHINTDDSSLNQVSSHSHSNANDKNGNANANDHKYSTHAFLLVRLSILSSWAELHLASYKHNFLIPVVQPNLKLLLSFWISSLCEFSRLKQESEMHSPSSMTRINDSLSAVSSIYLAFIREINLPFYEHTWIPFIQAVASLISSTDNEIKLIFRPESVSPKFPPKSFYIIFGLCISMITTEKSFYSKNNQLINKELFSGEKNYDKNEIIIICLDSILKFFNPVFAGTEFLYDDIFFEIMAIFERLSRQRNTDIQYLIVAILNLIAKNYPYFYTSLDSDAKELIIDDVNYGVSEKFYVVVKLLFYIVLDSLNVFTNPSSVNKSDGSMSSLNKSSSKANMKDEAKIDLVLSSAMETIALIFSSIQDMNIKIQMIPLQLYIYSVVSQIRPTTISSIMVGFKSQMDTLKIDEQSDESIKKLYQSIQAFSKNFFEKLRNMTELSEVDQNQKLNYILIETLILSSTIITDKGNESNHIQQKLVKIMIRFLVESLDIDQPVLSIQILKCISSFENLYNREDEPAMQAIGQSCIKFCVPNLIRILKEINQEKYMNIVKDETYKNFIEQIFLNLISNYSMVKDVKEKIVLLTVILCSLATYIRDLQQMDRKRLINFKNINEGKVHSFAVQTMIQLATAVPIHFKSIFSTLPGKEREKIEVAFRVNMTANNNNNNNNNNIHRKDSFDDDGFSSDFSDFSDDDNEKVTNQEPQLKINNSDFS